MRTASPLIVPNCPQGSGWQLSQVTFLPGDTCPVWHLCPVTPVPAGTLQVWLQGVRVLVGSSSAGSTWALTLQQREHKRALQTAVPSPAVGAEPLFHIQPVHGEFSPPAAAGSLSSSSSCRLCSRAHPCLPLQCFMVSSSLPSTPHSPTRELAEQSCVVWLFLSLSRKGTAERSSSQWVSACWRMHDSLVPTRAASLLPQRCASPPASPVPITPLQKSSLFISPSCPYLLCYEKPGNRENLTVLLGKRCYSFSALGSRPAGPSGQAHKTVQPQTWLQRDFPGNPIRNSNSLLSESFWDAGKIPVFSSFPSSLLLWFLRGISVKNPLH